MVDGVARIEDVEFAVEDIKFQRELLDRRTVEIAQQEKIMRVFSEPGSVGASVHVPSSVSAGRSRPPGCDFSIAEKRLFAKGRNTPSRHLNGEGS